MTSNLGSEFILEGIRDGEISEEARSQVDRLLKTHFRPEFLNRIDEIVCYKPLSRDEIASIVELMVKNLNARMEEKQLHVMLTNEAMEAVIDRGFDPVYGARPLKRYLQSQVETLIARRIIAGNVAPGSILKVDVDEDGSFVIR
jgi:ATP-dependent Clp protease ATP-binding subunit ClpB